MKHVFQKMMKQQQRREIYQLQVQTINQQQLGTMQALLQVQKLLTL